MTLVVGIGNDDRGDDAVGLAVARRLRAAGVPRHVTVAESSGEAAALVDAWGAAARVVLVDAVVSGASPGAIHRIDASAGPIPESVSTVSTHGFGVAGAIELARALGRLPESLVVYGIEGGRFDSGAPLTAGVARAARAVAAEIATRLDAEASALGIAEGGDFRA
jgi:hydrogenase maturation protease